MEEQDYPVDWNWYENAEIEQKENELPAELDRKTGFLMMGHEGSGWIESDVFFMDVSKNV